MGTHPSLVPGPSIYQNSGDSNNENTFDNTTDVGSGPATKTSSSDNIQQNALLDFFFALCTVDCYYLLLYITKQIENNFTVSVAR